MLFPIFLIVNLSFTKLFVNVVWTLLLSQFPEFFLTVTFEASLFSSCFYLYKGKPIKFLSYHDPSNYPKKHEIQVKELLSYTLYLQMTAIYSLQVNS